MRVAKWQVALGLVLLGVALLGAVVAVDAQNAGNRAACRQERFDINGDGVFNFSDLIAWKNWHAANGCALGQAITGEDDLCRRLDFDGDGILERSDWELIRNQYHVCFSPVLRSHTGR